MSFQSLTADAAKKYGISTKRPQDLDKHMLVTCRQNNLGKIHELGPINCQEESLSNSNVVRPIFLTKSDMNQIVDSKLPQNCVHWIANADMIKNWLQSENVFGFDLEFHNQDTYEGFIAVASVSSSVKSAVVEALYEGRAQCIKVIGRFLEDQYILKVFCGASNDLIRLGKDWNCKPVNFIDVQLMYAFWKMTSPDDCYLQSRAFIKRLLQQKRKRHVDIDGADVRNYFLNYDKPSLSFLIDLCTNGNNYKNGCETFADFRTRPLHPNLVAYAGYDAYYALRVFAYLGLKIGKAATTTCLQQSMALLPTSYSVTKYKSLKLFCNDDIGRSVQQWREYLAKNLDQDPEKLISGQNVSLLIDGLRKDQHFQDSDKLPKALASYGLQDNAEKAASLLRVYLDPTRAQLEKMKNIICHRCNTTGHTARFCFRVLSAIEEREAKRNFRNRDEMKYFKQKQYQRRIKNYIEKRNVSRVPWEHV